METCSLIVKESFHTKQRTMREIKGYRNRTQMLEMHHNDADYVDTLINTCRAMRQWRRCPEAPTREDIKIQGIGPKGLLKNKVNFIAGAKEGAKQTHAFYTF